MLVMELVLDMFGYYICFFFVIKMYLFLIFFCEKVRGEMGILLFILYKYLNYFLNLDLFSVSFRSRYNFYRIVIYI